MRDNSYCSAGSNPNLLGVCPGENMIPSKFENPEGLHHRYNITKADGSPVDLGAEYFVLRLDDGGSDPIHIAACRKAVLRYADEIEQHILQLAADLRARYSA